MKSEEDAFPKEENHATIPSKNKRNRKTDPLNRGFKTPLKEHRNPLIRGFAKTGYTIWIVVMVVGLILAFIIAIFLV